MYSGILRPISMSSSSTRQCAWQQVERRWIGWLFHLYSITVPWAGQYVKGDPSKPLHQCNLYGSKEAGAKLGEMLKIGTSRHWTEVTAGLHTSMISNVFRQWRWWRESPIWAQTQWGNTSFPWRSGWKRRTRRTGWGWAGTMTTVKSCAQTRHRARQQTRHLPVRQQTRNPVK